MTGTCAKREAGPDNPIEHIEYSFLNENLRMAGINEHFHKHLSVKKRMVYYYLLIVSFLFHIPKLKKHVHKIKKRTQFFYKKMFNTVEK